MDIRHTNNIETLRAWFEGKEGIYVMKGALRVRITNIRQAQGFGVEAVLEEIITPGLGFGRFWRKHPPVTDPRRFDIGAGANSMFSPQCWSTGYPLAWQLYIEPQFIQAVLEFAAGRPNDADPMDGYSAVCRMIRDWDQRFEPSQPVFPQAADLAWSQFPNNGLPPVTVQVSKGWVLCPCCELSFALSNMFHWNGERHRACGQKLIVAPS